MIDTVTVSYPVSLTSGQLYYWKHTEEIELGQTRKHKFTKYQTMQNGAGVWLVYYPPNPPLYKFPWLSIQASLPKVLRGDNIELITSEAEIKEVSDRINNFIAGFHWLPKLDFYTGYLFRLDAAFNHFVGPNAQNYVKAISIHEFPQRKTKPYHHQGVQFSSDVANTNFYDKEKECGSASAFGILRQETQIIKNFYIGRRIQIPHPRLCDITIDMPRKILDDNLVELRLKGCTFFDKSVAQELLIAKYGYRLGNTLYGHLINRQSSSKEQIIAQGASKQVIRRFEKLIADAGITIALADDRMILPPLEITTPCAKVYALS